MEGKSLIIGIIIGLLILSAPSYILYNKLTNTQNKLNQDHENLTRCNQDKNILQSNITKLKQEYEKLMSDYDQLKNNYQQLQKRFNSLNINYTKTIDLYNKLKQAYNDLLGNYSKLKENYNTLQSQYSDLENNYAALQNEATQLRQNYQTLNNTYNQLLEEYNNLVDALMQAHNWINLFSARHNESAFYSKLLEESVDSAKQIVDLALFVGSPGYRSFSVFNYTLLWLNYCPDNYVRYVNLSNDKIMVSDDVFMLPNETWTNGCGDCEDLALFDYGILNLTATQGEKLYLVVFSSKDWDSAHVGLLLVWHVNNTKRYFVIDPAGNYYNGVGMKLKINVKDIKGTGWWYWLDPLDINYNTKEFLLNGSVAVIEYRDYEQNKWYPLNETPIYYYTDASVALHDWIVSYWNAYPVKFIEIIGPHTYKEFNSIIDAAHWITNNG